MGLTKELSGYEKQRLENIENNKKMLESLGLLRTFKPILEPIKKRQAITPKQSKPKPSVKRKMENVTKEPAQNTVDVGGYRVRRSLRVKGIEPDGSPLPDSWKDTEDIEHRPRPVKVPRDNYFGAPEGFPVGYHWDTRMECSADGIHRPTVAGIHGNESLGCYSIALSGGYEDDIDLGESFTYTGSGGRDLKGTKANPKNLRTAPQSKDQTLDKVNLALSRNVESRNPVRVIRGYKLQSPFAPEYGYRYDGLYTVEKFWSCTGLSGFLVYKYILKRMDGQAPPPWKETTYSDSDKENEDPDECSKTHNNNKKDVENEETNDEMHSDEPIRDESENDKPIVDEVVKSSQSENGEENKPTKRRKMNEEETENADNCKNEE